MYMYMCTHIHVHVYYVEPYIIAYNHTLLHACDYKGYKCALWTQIYTTMYMYIHSTHWVTPNSLACVQFRFTLVLCIKVDVSLTFFSFPQTFCQKVAGDGWRRAKNGSPILWRVRGQPPLSNILSVCVQTAASPTILQVPVLHVAFGICQCTS